MKYIYRNTSMEVKDWKNNSGEYFCILAFVHDIFRSREVVIPFDVPVPTVKFTDFHYNGNSFTNCKVDANVIYLPTKSVGKKLHASLITALIIYYGKETNNEELASEIIEEVEVLLTVSEVAVTSAVVVAGTLLAKGLITKLF